MLNQGKRFHLCWQGLSKNDTTTLKAVGITMIVLHNYFHLLNGWRIENEFSFSGKNFNYVRKHLSFNLYNDIGLLFAYLGHYGVQLFVFLSAYGLYTSYINKPLNYGRFIRDRIWKLWPAFFLAVLFMIAFTIIITRSFYHPDIYVGSLLRLSLLSNFFPGKSLSIVGPWWFYSMIVQFYFLFPLMRKWFDCHGMLPLLFISAVSIALVYLLFKLNATSVKPVALVIGHLPVFCLGLLLARHKNQQMPLRVLIGMCVLFALSNVYKPAWFFAQICITVIFLYGYIFLKKMVPRPTGVVRNVLFFVGNLSMYLFAVNGFLRAPFLEQAEQESNISMKWVVLIVFLVFVTLVALLLRFVEKHFLRLFSKPLFQKLPVRAMNARHYAISVSNKEGDENTKPI